MLFILLLCQLVGPSQRVSPEVAVIQVLDSQTGRGVPLVELETIAHNRFVTDSHGRVAITDPDLLGHNIFFTLRSHGYAFPQDGFGFPGKSVELTKGKQTQLTIQRKNIAERLYRATGAGIYVHSIVAGLVTEKDQPLLRADVVGCDSVMTAEYRDRLYWFWGDTHRPHYPIGGNFNMTGATTPLPKTDEHIAAAIDQPLAYQYITDDRAAIRGVAPMAGDGPTWLSAVTVLQPSPTSQKTSPTMVAGFIKVRNQLDAYRWGFARWDDDQQQFQEIKSYETRPRLFCDPQTHTFVHTIEGIEYVYFANPLPLTRVKATLDAFVDPEQYEAYTCLQPGSALEARQLERTADGQLVFAWKRNTAALNPQTERKFIDAGLIQHNEARFQLRDVDTGRPLIAHSGSVYWNKYRNRWVMIAVEIGGITSHLGEVWYAEADQPTGPWCFARKVVTHDQYSFYNPKHHPEFDSADGSVIYFEGTYTTTFSGNPFPTERYDYNQIMYRLDLKRAEMNLPVAIYENGDTGRLSGYVAGESKSASFFALDRPAEGCAGFVLVEGRLSRAEPTSESTNTKPILFYAYTTPAKRTPTKRTPAKATTDDLQNSPLAPLYEYTDTLTQARRYSTDPSISQRHSRRTPEPVCWVWKVD